jgi:CHAT domain-containing protein
MDVRADLVVLSADRSAQGQLRPGEGMLGLPRAFLMGGARHVLASLWHVDDAAALALMTKFHELWNPKGGAGIGPAEALYEAQAHVRSQEPWQHPRYWAGWVLYGLPD